MAQHIVTSFEDDLRGLARSIAEMGGHAEQLVERSIFALLRSDADLAYEVIEADKKVDELHRLIEERAILVIARRQPMAVDLREIIAAIRISSDLERVADLGKNIARRALAIQSQPFSQKLRVGVEHLAELGLRRSRRCSTLWHARPRQGEEVCAKDDEIDAVYTVAVPRTLTYMMEDPRNISMCTHLLFCAKNIERIGDHATNIAETVHYVITGEQWGGQRQSSTKV
jgi:phosphate transport system protein